MHIELRQLRYFVAVAEEMHFGRAAIKLNMSQPPLSQAIMALEQQLGAPLFIRDTRKICLSVAGEVLLPEARRLLAQAYALPQLAQRAASGNLGQIDIAFVSIADYSILPPLLQQFHQLYPQVQVNLREATSNVLWCIPKRTHPTQKIRFIASHSRLLARFKIKPILSSGCFLSCGRTFFHSSNGNRNTIH